MRFQIESVLADGKRVSLSDSPTSEWTDNTFTMVVGQNAAGKSRLLRKIVSTYVFARQDRPYSEVLTSHFISAPEDPSKYTGTFTEHFNAPYQVRDYPKTPESSGSYDWPRQIPLSEVKEVSSLYFVPQKFAQLINTQHDEDVRLSIGSAVCPTHVIAVSTGRHDRFPSLGQSKKKPSGIKYSYIGSDRPNGSGVPSSLSSLIDGVMKGQQNAYRLSNIFEYLGFAPYLDVKLAFDIKQFNKLLDEEKSEIYLTCTPEIIDFLSDEFSYLPYEDDHKYKFFDTLKRQKKSHLEIYLWDLDVGTGHDLLSDLSVLLRFGIIKIYDITLLKKINKSRLRLSQASSGQQCMLTMMLGIAGSIQNGSLICIDEPEISLHPQWQSSLVKQLQEVFADYHGCHFIIATHSPQLVSGLVTDNGYVLSLEEGRLYKPYEYAKRSADFQLAEIFQSPGQNNEYLLRTVLILLTKIAKREDFNEDDKETAVRLFKLQSKMSDVDPVYHLISQLGTLY